MTGSGAPASPLADDVAAAGRGLLVLRASRLEALVEPLWALLDATWPDDVLAPQTIVAAHPGMKQWLTGELARLNGVAGVLANLDIVLPSTWFDRLAQARMGERAISLPRYQAAHLRWTLHGLLDPAQPIAGVNDARVSAYLGGDGEQRGAELARRRFQLADRLARIYSQYLVYRPDWLAAWERGQFSHATGAPGAGAPETLESGLMAPLWRQLAGRLGRHRGQAMEELRASLDHDASARPALHVFGVNHMAPSEVAVLRAYSQSGLVTLFVPDPCREYWGGLKHADRSAWQHWRRQETARIDAAGEGDYWQDQDHPLLARWGRMGQHFFSALNEGDLRESTRHWLDENPPVPETRLQRLQESIRQLAPVLLRADVATPAQIALERADPSLRIHACHTRQRELEVLRNSLLDALAAGIAPGEMVVMAPDIQAYLPLIPAVFGEPGTLRERRLPYHLADVPMAASHRLFTTVKQLLALPGQRITAPEVVDLLSVPEIQRRLGIDEEDVESLVDWLRQSRVAWALDGSHRAGFGVPPMAEHSFAWALDRMVAGYLMSDAPQADRDRGFVLPDGTELAPVTGIGGPAAEALGALDRLLQEVQAWCDLSRRERPASEWARQLEFRIDALFRIDPTDRAARDALEAVKRFASAIETEPANARENPQLNFAVVRDLLHDRLESLPEHPRFLMGGITFCGMVPQRAIPFRMVAVLGLNDGAYPRSVSDGGLDLMTRLRRLGDRDVRSDDRYLFLETVMAARDRLHLGFLGEGVQDGKPRNPAAPLAELMAELDAAHGLAHDADDERRPWLVRHPLQPFDARYFAGSDPCLFSYSRRYQDMHGSGLEPPAIFLQPSTREADPVPDPMPLSLLAGYYKDPARNLLEKRLKLSLDALDDARLPEDEPLAGSLDPMATVARRMFFQEALPRWGAWSPKAIPDWVRLTGLLPPGRQGQAAWQREVTAIGAALEAAMSCPALDATVAMQGRSVAIAVAMGEPDVACRLTGEVHQVFPVASRADGMQLVRAFTTTGGGKGGLKAEQDLHFGERVGVFLDWALLRLHCAQAGQPWIPVQPQLLVKPGPTPWQDGIRAWDDALLGADAARRQAMLAALQGRIARLLRWWRAAQTQPHWYFPRTSWKAVSAVSDDGDTAVVLGQAVQGAWNGFDASGERNFAPGYNALLAGEVAFDDAPAALQGLLDFARALQATITLEAES